MAARRWRLCLGALALLALVPGIAFAGIIDDAAKQATQGMLDAMAARMNAVGSTWIPTSFDNLLDGGAGSAHLYAKALQFYGGGVARSIASSILALVLLVQLVKIAGRVDGNQTLPAVREVITLIVACAIYTYLVAHAWDLVAGLFADLAVVWSHWTADAPVRVPTMDISAMSGLHAMAPLLLSCAIAMLMADVATIVSRIVIWGRAIQLYFMATMSPIPLALLGLDETRQMGIGFLRNFAALVLGYAALTFVLYLFPTLLSMAVAAGTAAGGTADLVLSVTAASVLEVMLVVHAGSWARDLLGG